jgi:concentrative nucleoside transporter, CNT family
MFPMHLLVSLLGIAVLLALAVLLSANRRMIQLRTVIPAFVLQTAIAALILYVPGGDRALGTVVHAVQNVIDYAYAGIEFVLGDLGKRKPGAITIAFHVLPVIVFFSALMSVLYYLGIMQKVISILGGGVHKLLGTSRTESMSAVANIFIGHTEAPLVVRPYLAGMTESELFAVMTGGCATIAGAVMAAYASMGIDLKYLITASFMAAPGGLLMAKIVMPETAPRDAIAQDVQYSDDARPVNVFEAIANGARDGLMLALNVGAMLLAFVAMIALLNGLIGWVGGFFGEPALTFEQILGVLLRPLAWVCGVPWVDAGAAGSLIGQKFVVNEFVAYINLAKISSQLQPQTQVIVTFALCGFANLSSIAILLGGLGSLVPARRSDVARLGLRAVLAGSLSNLMSAVLAGLFLSLKTV